MQTGRKFVAIALALALLLLQVPMALATSDAAIPAVTPDESWILPSAAFLGEDFAAALEAGREMRTVFSATWHGLPLLDEETNSLLSSLLGSIVAYTTTAKTENGAYLTSDLSISGMPVLSLTEAVVDGEYYLDFTQLPAPIKLSSMEDFSLLYVNLIAYLVEIGAIEGDVEDFEELQNAMVGAQMAPQYGEMDDVIEALALQPMVDAFTAWFEDIATGEPYEGEIASVFGVEATSATLYQLTKDDIVSLVETMLPLLKENEALWQTILSSTDTSMFTDETGATMSVDEMVATIQQAIDVDMFVSALDEIPDDITLYYAECFDASGNTATNFAHMIIPSDYEDENLFEAYIEWLPDCSQLHASFTDDYDDGFTVDVTKGAAEAEGMTDQFTAVLTVLSSGEAAMQFVADAVWGTVETGEGTCETNTTVLLGMVDPYSGQEMGIQFKVYEAKELYDIDVSVYTMVEINLVMSGMEMPVLTLSILNDTGEMSGMPFDPVQFTLGAEAVNPATMNADEFAEWIEKSMLPAFIQIGLTVLGRLPTDVFAWIAEETGMMSGF